MEEIIPDPEISTETTLLPEPASSTANPLLEAYVELQTAYQNHNQLDVSLLLGLLYQLVSK
jgi:hypothetical protein